MSKYLCPEEDFTCPYYNWNTGKCELENPKEDCDDYAFAYFDDDEEADWDA